MMEVTLEQINDLFLKHSEILKKEFKIEIEKAFAKPKSIRITQKMAYDIYGRTKTINWRLQGLLKAYKIGRTVEYEVAVLDRLMENRQLIIKH